ncbi:MAG: DUF1565 domain-containing protein, partial [Candidatus Korarchaeota archaeon]|nr:DUF1565 domain-containing protein [Candidatus Korarchaeota archaeon]
MVQLVKAAPATITVPDDYLTIQEAINNADEGDTVFVRNGTYYESVVVNKTISLIGESREATIIDASGSDYGISITADNVTVRGFTVQGAHWWGIWIKSSGCRISDNNVVASTHEGIYLDGREPEVVVRENTIEYNCISGNRDCGILVWASCDNQILSNIVGNNWIGIFLYLNASHN